jgi:hypothetical protein
VLTYRDVSVIRSGVLLTACVLFAMLEGCGGGSSSAGGGGTTGGSPPAATQTGQLVDEVVQGASYYTSTGAGGCATSTPCTTDATGTFKFAAGDTVTFTALGVKLGAVTPAATTSAAVLIMPNTLTGESNPTGPKAFDIAKFLHMISTPTQQGMQINTNLGSVAAAVPNADATQISDFTAVQASIKQSSGVTVSIPADSAVTAALTQTATLTPSTISLEGSVWRGTCDSGCGGGTFTLTATGELFGFTDSAELISGTWSVKSDGSITLNLISSGGGGATGSLPAGKTSCTSCLNLTSGNGSTTTLSLAEVSATSTTSAYAGLWYVGMTPTSQGAAAGLQSGGAVVVASPDGKVYGLTDGAQAISGSWSASNGQGTASVTTVSGSAQAAGTVSFDLSKLTGTLSVNNTTYGNLLFNRTNGTPVAPYFVLHPKGTSAPPISLVLNLTVNWKNFGGSGSGGYSESLALDAHVDDSTGNRIASLVKPEQTYILFGTANIPPTTDDIAISYPTGAGVSYHVKFGNGQATMTDAGGMTCTITNGDGTVNDGNQGNPSKYPTVAVSCM